MKKNDALLGSGQLYFVTLKESDEHKSFILDEWEYNIFFDWLNNDAKFLKVWDNYHFWWKIDKFWKVKFEEWAMELYSSLPEEYKQNVRNWATGRVNNSNLSSFIDYSTVKQCKNLSLWLDAYDWLVKPFSYSDL
jgi:hypothetical protein